MSDGYYRLPDGRIVHLSTTETGWLISYADGTVTEVRR